MIARLWRGWTSLENADAYERLLQEQVLPGLKGINGYQDGYILRQEGHDEVDVSGLLSHWRWFDEWNLGCIGVLSDWLVETVDTLCKEGATTLTIEALTRHALQPDQRFRMEMEAHRGTQSRTSKSTERARTPAVVREPGAASWRRHRRSFNEWSLVFGCYP